MPAEVSASWPTLSRGQNGGEDGGRAARTPPLGRRNGAPGLGPAPGPAPLPLRPPMRSLPRAPLCSAGSRGRARACVLCGSRALAAEGGPEQGVGCESPRGDCDATGPNGFLRAGASALLLAKPETVLSPPGSEREGRLGGGGEKKAGESGLEDVCQGRSHRRLRPAPPKRRGRGGGGRDREHKHVLHGDRKVPFSLPALP